jgi:parallel beta-helix repeat protein
VGHSYGIYVENASATITNCTFSLNAYAVYQYTGTSTVSDCTISGNYSGNCTEHGSTTFANCVFSGNTGEGFATRFGAATVINCLIRGSASGVDVFGAPVSVINCTLTDNTVGINSNGGSTTVTNSIVAWNQTGMRRTSTSVTVTPTYNDVYANATANYTNIADPSGTNGNISADPWFANRTGGDYRLLLGSPCIDAGNDTVVTPGQTELGGGPRIIGPHVDMGGYEAGPFVYSPADAAKALRMAAGLEPAPSDIARWNVAPSTPSVDIADALRIARMAAGLDPKP